MTALEREFDPSFDETENRRLIYMDVLKTIVQEIAHFHDLSQMLDYVVAALQARLQFHIASIFRYDAADQRAILVAQQGSSYRPAPIGYVQSIHEGLLGRTLREQKTLLIEDTSQLIDYVTPAGYEPACAELCVPIFAHDELWGAFNVENMEPGSFSSYDQMALELIATQLGSSIANLHLLQQQQQMLEQLSSQTQRQQELLDQVLQLSTPVFPVYPGILAVPLVGTLDSDRMEHTTAALLNAIQQSHSSTIILDVTGIINLDATAAQTLSTLLQASNLLGCEVILTGIRPEVACLLVALPIKAGRVVAHPTFSGGLQYALQQRGLTINTRGVSTFKRAG